MKSNKGFTLIELMISVSILSLLLFLGSYSYQLLSNRWQKDLGDFSQTMQVTKNLTLATQVLDGLFPFVVNEQSSENVAPAVLFVGKKHTLFSATRAGLFDDEYPEVFRISVIEKENGKYRVDYQSRSTRNLLLLTTQQEFEFQHHITLFDDLDDVQFEYYGWNGFVERSDAPETGENATWRSEYSGIDNQLMPEKVVFSFVKDNETFRYSTYSDHASFRYISLYLGRED